MTSSWPWAALSRLSGKWDLHWWHMSALAQCLIAMVGYMPWPAVSQLRSFGILIWVPSGRNHLLDSHLSIWFNTSCPHLLSPFYCTSHEKTLASLVGKSEFPEFSCYDLVPKRSFATKLPCQFLSGFSSFRRFTKLTVNPEHPLPEALHYFFFSLMLWFPFHIWSVMIQTFLLSSFWQAFYFPNGEPYLIVVLVTILLIDIGLNIS